MYNNLHSGADIFMKQNILEKIKDTIKKYNMIEPGDGVVVGFPAGRILCVFFIRCARSGKSLR